jgi:hypothetical protein
VPDASRDGVCALIDQAMAVIKKDSRAIVGPTFRTSRL